MMTDYEVSSTNSQFLPKKWYSLYPKDPRDTILISIWVPNEIVYEANQVSNLQSVLRHVVSKHAQGNELTAGHS